MKFISFIILFTPTLVVGFLPTTLKTRTTTLRKPNNKHATFIQHNVDTSLHMAFDDSKPTNMFQGPAPLVKERDACGVGFIANIQSGEFGSHKVLQQGLTALGCMEHRGACGGDGVSGDGAGIMTQIPFNLLGVTPKETGVGMVFLPRDEDRRNKIKDMMESVCTANELEFIGWREVPINPDVLGDMAKAAMPSIWQFFVKEPTRLLANGDDDVGDGFERTLYLVRRRFDVERRLRGLVWDDDDDMLYIPSFSSRTIVYKGMVQSEVLSQFYLDLTNEEYTTQFIIYHRRFSTNTNPKWPLAQPMRVLGHNGEINTLLGNMNWIKAREASKGLPVSTESDLDEESSQSGSSSSERKSKFQGDIRDLVDYDSTENIVTMCNTQDVPSVLEPLVDSGRSDSANLDAVFELMCHSRHRAPCALMALVPTAYIDSPDLVNNPEITDFYKFHGGLLEAWDGPALLVFSDGKSIGASLDRNGLRPARYSITKDGTVYMMSETGVLSSVEESDIVEKGRLGPGQMINVDLKTGEFKDNIKVKSEIASRHPYGEWIANQRKDVGKLSFPEDRMYDDVTATFAQATFGWGLEDIGMQITDMAGSGKETTYSMGDDAPLAVLSERSHPLYNYFKQRFAQVTNPPIDPLREGIVMSLSMTLGKKESIYNVSERGARLIHLDSPLLNENEMKLIEDYSNAHNGGFKQVTVSTRFDLSTGPSGLKQALDKVCDEAAEQVRGGAEVVILSDMAGDKSELEKTTYIPPLLAVGGVHHRLIEEGLRMDAGIIVQTGGAWSTHHFACLVGYGANAVHPYLALETVKQWHGQSTTQQKMDNGKLTRTTVGEAQQNYRKAVEAGLLKILSKMGISLLTSYAGAQIFEAIGIGDEVVDFSFRGTTSRIGGMGFEDIAQETASMRPEAVDEKLKLVNNGYYKPINKGEYHANTRKLATLLHNAIGLDTKVSAATNRDELENDGVKAANVANYEIFQESLRSAPLANIRDLMEFESDRESVPIEEVEPASEIMRRFCTGAMSLGALSREAHETLAIAANRIGGKSNSGEGGEDVLRGQIIEDVDERGRSKSFPHLAGLRNGDSANSFIHQVASGRFGVTPEFLVTAKQLEIKMAQGAKPGEGGQLPGPKVSTYIASLRASKEGVTLISPPPHHDIYSIEDLAQLIHDLHTVNERAGVSVKLVSSIGIGTVACGVAKAGADVIQISGGDGGTGASPLSSIKHAGCPWELGLTEAHSALFNNGLRDRVVLRADGGIRTGLDVVSAAMMGAEEFGFGTIAMIAEGCVMARVCHLNTCPVGVTSQKENLRKKFPGTPEHVVNFFEFVAEEVRSLMAHLGYTRFEDLIGRTDLLSESKKQKLRVSKTKGVDLNPFFSGVPNSVDNREFLRGKIDGGIGVPKEEIVHTNGASSDLDRELCRNPDIQKVISDNAGEATVNVDIYNVDRSTCAMVAGDIARVHGNKGFMGKINVNFEGSAGQSFGAFVLPGLNVRLTGEANDYVGKGMHGGEIVVVPPLDAGFKPSDSSIVGNACLYGATGGDFHAEGRAGERFGVRNSGAFAVAEGAGDHCCEYMTGGVVVILGSVGRNVGAGMTGGVGYFYDVDGTFQSKVNGEIVSVQRVSTVEGEAQLKSMIERHFEKTGSERASEILKDWDNEVGKFWQIYPPSEAASSVVTAEGAIMDVRVSASAPTGDVCFLRVGLQLTPDQTARCAD